MLGGESHKKKKKHSDDYYYRGERLIYCKNLLIQQKSDSEIVFTTVLSFLLLSLYQTTMGQVHLPTRRSTSLQTVPLLCRPPHPPTRQIRRWASCRLSPLHWPRVQTPAPTCTRNPPTPPSPRTLPRTANARAAAVVEAKGATPSLTPALCLHRHLPPKSTPPLLPQSRLCSMAELPKRSP